MLNLSPSRLFRYSDTVPFQDNIIILTSTFCINDRAADENIHGLVAPSAEATLQYLFNQRIAQYLLAILGVVAIY